MAAKVAAVAGLVAAGAAQANAAPTTLEGNEAQPETQRTSTSAADVDRLTENIRQKGPQGCLCSGCWGPPAPPEMAPLGARARGLA